jgi:hypothetical protein
MRTCSWLYGGERDAPRIKLGGVRLVLGAGEDVDFSAPADVYEAGVLEYPIPLCFQQSTGDSPAPKVDVVLCVLRHLLVDDDVRYLDAAAGLEHPVDLLHHDHLVGAEIDYPIADDDID